MFEGRDNNAGWVLVASAVIALVVFTGLLYIRGGSAPKLTLGGGGDTAVATPRPTPSRSPTAPSARASGRPSARRPANLRSAAQSRGRPPRWHPKLPPLNRPRRRRPRPRRPRGPRPPPGRRRDPAEPRAAYQLPKSPQRATVALENGQGDCPNFPVGGVVVDSVLTQPSSTRLTATSPSGQTLSGRIRADGSFSLSAENPTERWVGSLTATGGTGSYFVVTNGCTEGYETTIAFN